MAAEEVLQSPCNGAQSSPVYEAHPLKVSDDTNIRLLSFVPTSSLDGSKIIKLNIGVFAFNDAPRYTALSYVWGQDPPIKEIFLDKHLVKVRSNLWDFLDRARHDNSITYLWIDALCIDQSSIAERNHQVAIMGPIYKSAEMVIVWLGAGPPDLVEAVHRLALVDWSRISLSNDYHDGGSSIELLSDMSTLSQAEYWRRMWTIQEYALASEISLWCGHYEDIMATVVEMYGMIGGRNKALISDNGVSKMWRYDYFREYHHKSGTEIDLPDVLDSCSGYLGQCSGSKDRIYSILSLTDDEDFTRYPIDVDYGQTTVDLFFSLVNRRFEQLDEKDMALWLRLSELRDFARQLAGYLEIESDLNVALTNSELEKLDIRWWTPESELRKKREEHDVKRAANWQQMWKLISQRGGNGTMSVCRAAGLRSVT